MSGILEKKKDQQAPDCVLIFSKTQHNTHIVTEAKPWLVTARPLKQTQVWSQLELWLVINWTYQSEGLIELDG